MAVLKVRRYGDPTLRRRATPVGEITPDIRNLVADMVDTMYDEAGIGLAAPQIGMSLRLSSSPTTRRVRPAPWSIPRSSSRAVKRRPKKAASRSLESSPR